jgi:3-oxoacyl-[acyl-carrier protein] reductase
LDLELKGKRALVLGSSGGLGKAIAQRLVEEGARVALCSRDAGRIQAAAKEVGAEQAIALDLGVLGNGQKVVQEAMQGLGGVDILVTNTGGPPSGSFLKTTGEQWQQGFQSLYLSAIESIQEALPAMQQAGFGRILLVTSIAAKEPTRGLTISNRLRAGLLGLMKTLSDEVAASGVTVNSLLPGYTATDRMRQLGVTDERIASEVPARRMGKPEEFAAAAAFLASGLAGYITGQALAVDGGWLRSS